MTQPVPARTLIPVLGALTAFGPASIDMYLPSLPGIAADFGVGPERIQATLGTFFAGLAAGMLLYGPLSDRLGRRPLLGAGMIIYVVASVGCALAGSVEALSLWRFVQALGGGAAMVLTRAVIRDCFETDEGARVLSLMMLVIAIAPLLAPSLGAVLLVELGWRSIFWGLALFGTVCLGAVWWLVPETLPPERRYFAGPLEVLATYAQFLRQRRSLGYLLTGGAAFCGLMAYISGSPFAYITYFGVAPRHYGLLFGLAVVGIMVGNLVNSRMVVPLGHRRLLAFGAGLAGLAGAALLAETLFPFGHLALLVAPLVLYVGSLSLTGTNAVTGLMALHPRQAGSASALFGAAQFGLGAFANVCVGWLGDGTPRGMCLVVGCSGLICLAANRVLLRPAEVT